MPFIQFLFTGLVKVLGLHADHIPIHFLNNEILDYNMLVTSKPNLLSVQTKPSFSPNQTFFQFKPNLLSVQTKPSFSPNQTFNQFKPNFPSVQTKPSISPNQTFYQSNANLLQNQTFYQSKPNLQLV